MPEKKLILAKEVAAKKLQRIALEIAGDLYGSREELIVIGITGSGMVVAGKVVQLLQPLLDLNMTLITCTLNKRAPHEISYSERIDFSGKNVLVVDDVVSSGRTLLYALKPLLEFYPKRIQTVSLVERTHKHFPVKTDYIGLSIATTLEEHIVVEVEGDEILGAYIM